MKLREVIDHALVASQKEIRKFGLIFASILALLFFLIPVLRGRPGSHALLLVAVFIALTALALPRLLRALFVAASLVGHVLGAVNQRILLALMFFLIVLPLGLIQRWLLGRDPMGRSFASGASSYKVYCKEKNLSANKERTF
jgi:hypothetical protein